MSPLQRGWKWNEQKMDWSTDEDFIDTSKPINRKLLKYNCHELIRNMPEQFRRLNLNSNNDCKFIVATCDEPIRAMAIHAKLSTKFDAGDGVKISAFDILDNGNCRRIMLKFTHDSLTKDSVYQN